jgi:ABC-type nitrate/sulfonate/bicarbonate transport system substrate-binding protein
LLAACSNGASADVEEGEGAEAQVDSVRVAYTSSVDPGEVAFYAAATEFGEEFGLAQEADDLQVFESHGTAAQVVLSGGADVIAGSFLSDLQIIASGEPLKVFCPASSGFDSRLVGVGDVDDLAMVADPETRLAIEGPGGPVNFFTDLVLRARGVDINTTEMTNVSIIEDSPLRVAALANGDVDVALINAFQVPQLEEQVGAENVHILSNVMEDVGGGGIFLAFAASEDYLNENLEEATAFCASVLQSNRTLASDFEKYVALSNEYIEPDVEEELLRETWNSVVDATLWPYNNGLTEEGVEGVIDVAMETGLLEERLDYADIVDSRPIEGALELLGGEVDPESIKDLAQG